MPSKLAAVVTVLVVGSAAAIYGGIVRPRLLGARQVYNHARCQGIDACVRQYFETAGRFPLTLGEAVPQALRAGDQVLDGWGHEFLYKSDGKTFLLVSYGRDGKSDGSDYLALRASGNHPPGDSICGQYDADEVMSDVGWHRLCGK